MDAVNKTLYIPLYGKAWVSRRGLLLRDPDAERIWDSAGITLKGRAASKWLSYSMGIRSAVYDRWLEENLKLWPGAVVIHLGCGLDSRFRRVGARRGCFYDVDFPQVIQERKKFFREEADYRMLCADIREEGWLESIRAGGDALVVMEGVSMYLTDEERRRVLKNLAARFDRVKLLMDGYTVFGARASRLKNPVREVGVTRVYGFDDPGAQSAGTGLSFDGERDMNPPALIDRLPEKDRKIFRLLYTGRTARSVYRLYEYSK